MTPYVEKLLPFCEELGQAAFKIAAQLKLTITEHKVLEPTWLAAALLCRTIGNFRAVVRLAEQDLIVEARVLTRCCFENAFLIGGLYSQGVEFAKEIRADDAAGKKARLKFIMENESIFAALSEETREEMSKAQEAMQLGIKGGFLKFKAASMIGPFREMYLAYSQYSGDAAHPTFTALMRHFHFKGDTAVFELDPRPTEDQQDETLHLACVALISAAAAVNEMCGLTEAGKRLPELSGRLKDLQVEHFGERTLGDCESLEIKTKQAED